MNLLSERLLWAMQEEQKRRNGKRVTKAELARVAGVSDTAAGNWLKGDHGIDAANARALAAHLTVDPLWLETGEGVAIPEPVNAVAQPFDENVRPAVLGTRSIPVISAVQAGALKDMENPYEPGDGFAVEYTDDKNLSRWTFGLEVEGDSMLPRFRPGDRVIVDPEVAPNPGNFVVARNGSNQATLKKYRPRGIDATGNTVFELVPLNDDYPTLRSDLEHLLVIGVVVELRQKMR
jgi:SOS-response transcriptional repressor LexA